MLYDGVVEVFYPYYMKPLAGLRTILFYYSCSTKRYISTFSSELTYGKK
jgi:hypothetical protein